MTVVGVFGGSFNPPTIGHMLVATWVRLTGQADEVWFVPSRVHPFGKESEDYIHRVHLVHEAVDGTEGCRCAAIEHLIGSSYSIDVLDHLTRSYPSKQFRFVMGSDLCEEKHKWKDWERIQAEYTPIVVPRTGLAAPSPGVSSTLVRETLARGGDVSELVPSSVLPHLR